MYVKPITTKRDILKAIHRIESELNNDLSDSERDQLHEELDYLYSFIEVEE